jgi:hypothetical protein
MVPDRLSARVSVCLSCLSAPLQFSVTLFTSINFNSCVCYIYLLCCTSVVCHNIHIDQFQFLCLSQYSHRSISILVSFMSICSTSVVYHNIHIDQCQFLCLSCLSVLLQLSVTVFTSTNFNSC